MIKWKASLEKDSYDVTKAKISKYCVYSRTGTRSSYFLVDIQSPKDLGRVEKMLIVEYSGAIINPPCYKYLPTDISLLGIESDQRKVEDKRNPIPVDKKECGQKCV